MTENHPLKEARDKHGWSQKEVADRIGCGEASYFRWETQGVLPTPYYRRKLSGLFGQSIEELGLLPSHRKPSSAILPKEADLDLAEIRQAVSTNLFLQLCSLMDEPTHECRCAKYARIIEEFEDMNMHHPLAAEMTRRQAVTSLALLPFTPPLRLAEERVYTLSAAKHDLFLQQVGAALVACEDLAASPDQREKLLAFRCVSRYLTELKELVKTPSPYLERAQELASRCAILKTNMGWWRVGDATTVLFAQEAVEITRDFGHTGLHLSALSKRSWAYLYQGEEELALETAEEARELLERHDGPLPGCISGGTWSTLGVMRARNFLDPDFAIQKVREQRLENTPLYGMLFDGAGALVEQGIALGYAGKTSEALAAYAQVVDPTSLEIVSTFQGMETATGRLGTILRMAEASLTGKDHDMGEAIRYWQAALDIAKNVSSKHRERKIRTVYREMLRVFPGEKQVKKLGEQLIEKKEKRLG